MPCLRVRTSAENFRARRYGNILYSARSRILVGKRTLGRFRPRCLDNIEMDLQEMGFRTLNCVG